MSLAFLLAANFAKPPEHQEHHAEKQEMLAPAAHGASTALFD